MDESTKQTIIYTWPVGQGVIVQLCATGPLNSHHYDMLLRYLELAKEAEEHIDELTKPDPTLPED